MCFWARVQEKESPTGWGSPAVDQSEPVIGWGSSRAEGEEEGDSGSGSGSGSEEVEEEVEVVEVPQEDAREVDADAVDLITIIIRRAQLTSW